MARQPFLEYVEYEKKQMENGLKNFNALKTIPENPDPYILIFCKRLALIHRIQGNSEYYNVMLQRIVTLTNIFTKSKEPEHIKEEKFQKDIIEKTNLLCNYGEFQFTSGIYLFLAHGDTNKINQLLEWVDENCTLSDEYIQNHQRKFDEIAYGFLWRGYALLSLERYGEAYDCLIKVAPIYQNVKKTGGEMWHIIEFALTKALIPLCEFKLNPTKENLKMAQKGVDEYINSIRDNKFKLTGYVYYFHLKEQFADVYNADPTAFSSTVAIKTKPTKPKTISIPFPEYVNIEGSIIIYDPDKTKELEVVGRHADFIRFIDYVKKLGEYPDLPGLMDVYTIGQPQESKPFADDCRRFVSAPGIDPAMLKIGKILCKVIQESAAKDSLIQIYYDSEVEPDVPE